MNRPDTKAIQAANKRGEWTLTALYDAMLHDLNQCQTSHERIMAKAICEKEIRETADKIRERRKLNPGEVSVLQNIG